MHDAFVLVHSWLRWVVLAGAVYVTLHLLHLCFTGKPMRGADSYLVWAIGRAFLYQALFGVLLYIMLSPTQFPVVPSHEFDLRFGQPVYWPLVHGLGMLTALIVFHGGKSLIYRHVALHLRAPALVALMLVTLSLIIAVIPWPFMNFGRPLFRIP